MACPISWSPSVLAPVFFGHQDLSTSDGLPSNVRIFYPSIDSASEGASFLTDCGHYPLVLFLHGQCRKNQTETDHYLRWFEFPGLLARCGYVVAVPDFAGATDPSQDAHLAQALAVLAWMRDEWEHRAQLGNETAVAGHSFGGVLAGRLSALGAASAFISLSAGWVNAVEQFNILPVLGAPALLAWGTNVDSVDDDIEAQLDRDQVRLWNQVKPPKHRLRFIQGRHFDYLKPGQSICASGGPCALVGNVAADVAALFLSRYMPPPDAGLPKEAVAVTLGPPPLSLTPEQEVFAEGHLAALRALPSHPVCRVMLDEGPVAFFEIDPRSIFFGAVVINSVRIKTFTVTSFGEAPVELVIPPSPAGSVFSWDPFSGEVRTGKSLEVQVRFKPKTTKVEEATIPVTAFGTPHPIALQGKGAGGIPPPPRE